MFTMRATQLELQDLPDFAPRLVDRSYALMTVANRFLGGTRAVRKFIAAEALATGGRPLHVLDIGSGVCDIPLEVSRWAKSAGLDVRFTCLDFDPRAVEIGRRNIERANDSAVTLVKEDIFRHRPDEPYDCAVGSLFFHHLSDQNILLLIDRLRAYVRRSLLINDLQRGAGRYLSSMLAVPRLPWNVRHETLPPTRRGFKAAQLHELLQRLDNVVVSVKLAWFLRVQAVVRF